MPVLVPPELKVVAFENLPHLGRIRTRPVERLDQLSNQPMEILGFLRALNTPVSERDIINVSSHFNTTLSPLFRHLGSIEPYFGHHSKNSLRIQPLIIFIILINRTSLTNTLNQSHLRRPPYLNRLLHLFNRPLKRFSPPDRIIRR